MAEREIRNGDFVYRDALFVEVDGNKRHTRASVAELKELLLPKVSKATSSIKDQVGHFYHAQLIHHGLPQTRDKSAAKLRLIEAINSGRLVVPSEIKKIEADLKKQYANATRRNKAAAKKDAESDNKPTAKKRKLATDKQPSGVGSATRVSVKVGNVMIDIEQPSSGDNPIAKRQKKPELDKQKKPSTKDNAKPQRQPTPRKSSQPSNSSMANRQVSSPAIRTAPSARPRTKQTARRSRPFYVIPTSHRSSANDLDAPESPPPSYSMYPEEDDSEEEYPRSTSRNNVVQISGEYNLNVLNTRIDEHCVMRLYLFANQLWGTFDIGSYTGVIQLDDTQQIAEGAQKTFGWRSQHISSGRLKFGRGCDGTIEFDGNGGAVGRFNGLMYGQDIKFEAELDESFGYHSEYQREQEVSELMQRWNDFPAQAYGS